MLKAFLGHFVAQGLFLGPNLVTEISMWARQVTSWPGFNGSNRNEMAARGLRRST